MAINLEKGAKINLTKEQPKLKVVRMEMKWNENHTNSMDLDVSLFGLNQSQKLVDEDYFVFYNHDKTSDGSITKSPDELSGGSEWLKVDLAKVRSDAVELSVIVTIHKAVERKQTFNHVSDAQIALFNDETGEQIAFYDLDEQFPKETAVQIGSLVNKNNEWVFEAVGVGYELDLNAFIQGYTS